MPFSGLTFYRSLLVDSEDDTSAEKRGILVRETCVVIICVVPKALGCYTHTLASHLADNTLNNNLVLRDVAIVFDLRSNCVDNLLSPVLSVSMFILFIGQHSFDHILNDDFDFRWIKSDNQG